MYQPTAFVYDTESHDEMGKRVSVPGHVDLVLAYPAPGTKYGERTFTFAGRSPKALRRVLALLKHGRNGVLIGNEMAASLAR